MSDWRAAPADPGKMWLNRSLELQVTLACNWHCVSCDQGSQMTTASFIKRGTMSLAQVKAFVSEMHQANAYLGRIRVMGGEPTVHPQFATIMQVLHDELVVSGHLGALEVISNGSRGKFLEPVRHLAKLRISGESRKQTSHVANLVHSPASLGYRGKVCSSPWHCGISLNHWGYFPCSAGAGVARFMDDVPRWQRLTLPTCKAPCEAVRETWPDLQFLCDHCYHGLRDRDKTLSGTQDPARNKPGAHIAADIEAWRSGARQAEWTPYAGGAQ